MKNILKNSILFAIIAQTLTACFLIPADRIPKRHDFAHILPEDTEIYGIIAPKGSKLHYFVYGYGRKPKAQPLADVLQSKTNISKIEFPQAQKWGDLMISEIGVSRDGRGVSVLPVGLKNPIKTNWYECELNSRIYFTQTKWQLEKNWQAQNQQRLSGCEMANHVRVFIAEKPFVFNKMSLSQSSPSYGDTPNQSPIRAWYATLPERENSPFKFKGLYLDNQQNLTQFYGTITHNVQMGDCVYPAGEYVNVHIPDKNQSLWAWTRWDNRPQACWGIKHGMPIVFELFEKYVQ